MIIASNWKMNKSPDQAEQFILTLQKEIKKEDQKSFIFLVSALYFGILNKIFSKSSFLWGGQNCYFTDQGSFTGENSPLAMKQMGATYCLVGHSERRTLFFEDNAIIQKKISALLNFNMTPILCVGENLSQKKEGKLKEILKSQLQFVSHPQSILIAYEPVWAIGTGQTADEDSIREAVQVIYEILNNDQVSILYGGSVNEKEMNRLLQIKGLSGFLIGKKSLDFSSLLNIYKQIKNFESK